jgi:phosphoribosylamine--glycine ligase
MARAMVLGSGSREHAIVERFASEGHDVMALPGNAGTARVARNVEGRVDDVAGVVAAATRESVDLVVVGPELPLVRGVVDALEAVRVLTFGPSRAAAELEGSKVFMKRFLERHGIATAPFQVFDDASAAEAYVRSAGRPLVVKTDGLAAGKGVVVAKDEAEALLAVRTAMRDRAFGDAGARVVIEEVLTGEEASFHVVTDGERFLTLPAAQDHKRVFDGDRGANTGGMGAYAPAPLVTSGIARVVEESVIIPTLRGMRAEGAPFRGVLFVGLMIEKSAQSVTDTITVLEFNVRFGDPEACVLLPLVSGSFFDLLWSASTGSLPRDVSIKNEAAVAVVMAADGYPQKPRTGDVIEGLDEVARTPQVHVFHAGTRVEGSRVVTSSGRVLAVTATGTDLREAHTRAYSAVSGIRFDGEHHRTDIGARALSDHGKMR